MALSRVLVLFGAFALASGMLAILALRSFHRAGLVAEESRIRRAVRFQAAAGALPLLLVALATLGTAGAPLQTRSGWGFLAYGAAGLALGVAGAWLFRRAAGDPRRKWRKAAETAPLVLVMVDVVFLVSAWAQVR